MANLLLSPEDLTAASWSPTNVVVNADATTAPDGFVTADRIIDSGLGGGPAVVRIQQAEASLTNGQNFVLSCFAKADQLGWFAVTVDGFSGLDAFFFADLTNGVLGTLGTNVNGSGITDYGNGWYRPWITFTGVADEAGVIRPTVAEDDLDSSIDLDGTSSIFVWGIVLETGTTPTAYLSENGVTVVPSTSSQAPPYIAVTRRRADQMNVKQRMQKPKRGLFR